MKKLLGFALLSLALGFVRLFAADGLADAVAIANQRENEENYRRLSADIRTLLENQEVLQKRLDDLRQRLSKLEEEVRNSKEEQGRNSNSFVQRDELKKYVEKLKEIDEKREADKKLILESIKELAKTPPPVLSPPQPSEPKPKKAVAIETNDEGAFVYTVKKNDRLLDIIAEYNDHFQKNGQPKINRDDVMRANPGLKPDLLRAGQKIRIPIHSKESKSTRGEKERE